MSSITLPAIDTTLGAMFHAALNRATTAYHELEVDLPKIVGVVQKVEEDAVKIGTFILPILAKVAPQDAAVLILVLGFIEWMETLNPQILQDLQGKPGFSAMYQQFIDAKSKILAFENSL